MNIVFDLDGTLTLLRVPWLKVRRKVEALYGPIPKQLTVFQWLLGQERTIVEEVLNIVEEEELRGVEDACLDDELVKLVLKARERGFRLAVVTMQGRAVAERMLSKLRLGGVFNPVVTREHSLRREDQLKEVVDRWRIKPEEALFLTDRDLDLEAAGRVGVKALKVRFVDGSVKEKLREILGNTR